MSSPLAGGADGAGERSLEPQRRTEAAPLARRLGQPVGHRVGHAGVEPETAVAAVHLDVLAGGAGLDEARPPVHDPVAAGVDRRRRHRQWRPVGLPNRPLPPRRVRVADRLPEPAARRPISVHHLDGAAEGDHLADPSRARPRQLAPVDPAEAPTDDADRSLGSTGHLGESAAETLDHLGRGPQVGPQPPAVGPVAEAPQQRPQRGGRLVVGGEAG